MYLYFHNHFSYPHVPLHERSVHVPVHAYIEFLDIAEAKVFFIPNSENSWKFNFQDAENRLISSFDDVTSRLFSQVVLAIKSFEGGDQDSRLLKDSLTICKNAFFWFVEESHSFSVDVADGYWLNFQECFKYIKNRIQGKKLMHYILSNHNITEVT